MAVSPQTSTHPVAVDSPRHASEFGVLRPKRVLLFDHTAQLGGGEIALADLVRHFDPARVSPVVVLASDGPLVERLAGLTEVHVLPLAKNVLHARKDTLGFGALRQVKSGFHALRYVFRLTRFMEDERIDLIHTNSLKADLLGGLAGRLTGIPVVWHIRDRIAEDYLPRSMVRMIRTLARVIPSFVIANSAATLATVQLNGSVPSASVPSGVDLAAFAPDSGALQDTTARDAAPRIGLVGRICSWKGQHIFLRAAAEVHARFPTARFLIIGAALFEEREYEHQLKELVSTLGLEEVVEFTGFRKDVHALIQQLRILVHASTTGEPFGQVIVQGMAASKPVVATAGGGVLEIVLNGETGLLVPMSDAPAMAAAICSLLEDSERAERMGAEGKKRVLAHFTIQQSARKVEAIYEQVLHSQ